MCPFFIKAETVTHFVCVTLILTGSPEATSGSYRALVLEETKLGKRQNCKDKYSLNVHGGHSGCYGFLFMFYKSVYKSHKV